MVFRSVLSVGDRLRGDGFRDRRDWARAEASYRRYVSARPRDAAIWVQFGHALKEQNKLAEAADAYARAVELMPQDADALAHHADALERTRRPQEALAAYRRLYQMTKDNAAWGRILQLRKEPAAMHVADVEKDTLFFTIQDFFSYLKHHPTMSGIQRVQAGVAGYVLAHPAQPVRFILDEVQGAPSLEPGEFWMVDDKMLQRVIDYASGTRVDHATLKLMLFDCEESVIRVRPRAGNTIVLLGAFWGLGSSVERFLASARDGVRIGAYIYDLIPISHPQYCDANLVVDFTKSLCEICAVADFFLTISDATRHTLGAFIAQQGGRTIPMETAPLAHSLGGNAETSVWPRTLFNPSRREYVLYVSTIEGRKNHLYVVNAWRQMIEEGVSVPDLVFVGRKGWRIDALDALLESTDNLGGRIHIVHDLSDGELEAVYAGCLFTVFTSFVEGWGLPVGESLVHHRPCVASNTSSIPEVGGSLVDYIDPNDLNSGIAVFKRLLGDRTYLQARVQEIADKLIVRTWADVAQIVLAKITLLSAQLQLPGTGTKLLPGLTMPPGQILRVGAQLRHLTDLKRYFRTPTRLLLANGDFYPAEDHGAWLRGHNGRLDFYTMADEGDEVFVYVKLWLAPWINACRLQIRAEPSVDDANVVNMALASLVGDDNLRLRATAGPDGLVTLRLSVSGAIEMPAGDSRTFVVGVRMMGYAPVGDLTACMQAAEGLTLRDFAA